MEKSNQKVALVTGALSGIGRATAVAFAKEGYRVVISGRNEDAGQSLARELRDGGAEVEFVRTDVRKEADVEALVAKAVSRFGRLDVAVNNAGIEGESGPLSQQTLENYESTFDTNVRGVFLSLKHQMKVMTAQGSGSIVNVSSVLGHKAMAGVGIYTASKHAVEGLTKAAALEGAAAKVRVNAVAPGPIETPMLGRVAPAGEARDAFAAGVPVKRFGRPEEVAQTILFLVSDKAPFITGQSVGVDGGLMA